MDKVTIYKQDAIDAIRQLPNAGVHWFIPAEAVFKVLSEMPPAEPEDWMERNKERILQAGMEGREIEFRIGGRLFAIREKAQ